MFAAETQQWGNLRRAILQSVNIGMANPKRVHMKWTTLSRDNLRTANPFRAILSGANLVSAHMARVN